jgi:hypothetical protein
MEYLGAWGTLIHEKNLKSKISCQTPFKVGELNRLARSSRVFRAKITTVLSSTTVEYEGR